MVDNFEGIGMTDPFPDEKFNVMGNVKQPSYQVDVYQKSRYVPENSPSVIYIPTRVVMIKMMRACLGVTDPSQLWFK